MSLPRSHWHPSQGRPKGFHTDFDAKTVDFCDEFMGLAGIYFDSGFGNAFSACRFQPNDSNYI
jgi:hypothetical protein